MALVNKQSETRIPKRRIKWNQLIAEALKQASEDFEKDPEKKTVQYTVTGKERVAEHVARRAANTMEEKFAVTSWIERDNPAGTEWTAWFEIKPDDIERLTPTQAV